MLIELIVPKIFYYPNSMKLNVKITLLLILIKIFNHKVFIDNHLSLITMGNKETIPGFRSFLYRSGNVYNWLSERIHDQQKKYSLIAALIGNNSQKVLDLPCGTGFLARYLHPSTYYTGFDLNYKFLKKIKTDQRKGRINLKNVVLKPTNILDFGKYPKEKQDVVVLCDILHHIYPNHIELVETVKKFADKVILCEPVAIKPDGMSGCDFLTNSVLKITKYFPERVIKFLDFLFADNDGINSYENRSCWNHDDKILKELYSDLGFNKIYCVLDDYIGVWEN